MQADHLLSVAGASERAGRARARTRASPNTGRDHACHRTCVLTEGGGLPLEPSSRTFLFVSLIRVFVKRAVNLEMRQRMPTRFMLAVLC